jgi:hypothetical protein
MAGAPTLGALLGSPAKGGAVRAKAIRVAYLSGTLFALWMAAGAWHALY